MTKKHFIALADMVKATNPRGEGKRFNGGDEWAAVRQWEAMRDRLADFCSAQNFRFNRERWLAYIDGQCGPNGGAVKGVQS